MENNELKPVVFSIARTKNLQKLQEFSKKHAKCVMAYQDHDVMPFLYAFIPEGMLFAKTIVRCRCGEELCLKTIIGNEQSRNTAEMVINRMSKVLGLDDLAIYGWRQSDETGK